MLLYEKKKNSINVYKLNYDREQLSDYKKEKIELIPENERILYALELDDKIRCLSQENDVINLSNSKRKKRKYCLITNNKNQLFNNQRLDIYYNTHSNNLSCFTSQELKALKYYLIDLKNPKNIINNVIQVPEELYNLQLIFNKEFKLLKDKNLDEILELFTLSQLDEKEIKKGQGRHIIVRKSNIDDLSKISKTDSIFIKQLKR